MSDLNTLREELWAVANEALEQMKAALRGESETILSPRDLKDILQMATTLAIKIEEFSSKKEQEPDNSEKDLPAQWKEWAKEYERSKQQ